MTVDEFVDSVCISLNSFLRETRERVKSLLPMSVTHIMSKYQWEGTIRYDEFNTSTTNDWTALPDEVDKIVSLYRADLNEPIAYITPEEYVENKSADSTPYGNEAVRYTIMGGSSMRQKRIYFLDTPTSALTIKMFYSIKIDPNNLQALPDEFIPVIKSYVIYQLVSPYVEVSGTRQSNPSFITARNDYRKNLGELIARQQGQRGRDIKMELDSISKGAYQYFHP